MRNSASRLFAALLLILCGQLWLVNTAVGQAAPIERLFQNPKPEVERGLQELRATASGRLPILEGFVETTGQPLDHYERGYYQCVVQVTSAASGATLVRVTAKITAWYADANPAQSGYRALLSNGRLEIDLLDRLEELLAHKTNASAPPSTPESSHASELPRATAAPPDLAKAPAAGQAAVLRAAPALNASPAVSSAAPPGAATLPPSDEDFSSLRQRREEAERQIKELTTDAQNLEEILRNQAHPKDLAIVRKGGTPVFAKPLANAAVLFSADAEDEFQILDIKGSWVHVQITGASRGWIRRAQLDLPKEFGESSRGDPSSSTTDDAPFRVTREETHPFTGDWQPLRGQMVRILWIEVASKSSSAQAKRDFAKSLFLKTYREISSANQAVAGVVIVFDSPDGGQIAATLATLSQWHAGGLSDASFWQQCSLDPPESFQQ